MNELISIIVPVYNVKPYLYRCVDSIIKQTYKNIEILLIDDGSTDGSSELCDKLSDIDSRIKVIHKKNGGLSSARNRGLLEMNGKYVGFVDSDDYIREDMYSVLYHTMINHDADIVKSDFQYFSDKNLNIQDKRVGNGQVSVFDLSSALDDFIYTPFSPLKNMKSTVWDGLYSRCLFLEDSCEINKLKLSFPEGKINEDTYIFPDLLIASKRTVHISESFYFYYIRNNSIIHSPVSIQEINSRKMWGDINNTLLKVSKKYVDQCAFNWACRYITLLEKVYDSDFKDQFFPLILEELIDSKPYLIQHLSDKKLIRSLKLIDNYGLYKNAKKMFSRYFY